MQNTYKSTGSLSVDQMLYVPIQGDVIPKEFYKLVKKKDSGNTDFLAIQILSNIIYWYRPTVEYNEDGSLKRISKKFKSDMLQKNYDEYASMYDVTKRQVKAAFDTLESLGFIKRIFKTVDVFGTKISNVLFIELNINAIKVALCVNKPNEDKTHVNDVAISITNGVCADENTSCNKMEKVLPKKDNPVTKKCNTYTYIKTNTKSNITNFSHSIFNQKDDKDGLTDLKAYRNILIENTEIDSLIREQPADKEKYLEYLEIMLDLVCFNKKPVAINGNSYPAEVVKSRMLKLKREHLEHVCEIYNELSTPVTNFYKHCTATLYNSYYEVNNHIKNVMNVNSVLAV